MKNDNNYRGRAPTGRDARPGGSGAYRPETGRSSPENTYYGSGYYGAPGYGAPGRGGYGYPQGSARNALRRANPPYNAGGVAPYYGGANRGGMPRQAPGGQRGPRQPGQAPRRGSGTQNGAPSRGAPGQGGMPYDPYEEYRRTGATGQIYGSRGVRDNAPYGSRGYSLRPGIRGGVSADGGRIRKTLLIVLAVLAVIVVAALIIFPKLSRDGTIREEPETLPAEQTETSPPETDPEPEPELPKYAYAARTPDTKVFDDEEIKCAHAILIDLESNTVIGEKGGDDKIFPASMTKVMTALVAVEKCQNLDDTFTMTEEVFAPTYGMNATVAGFDIGDTVTVRDLLYGALLPSGADGTGGLALYTSGSEEAFVELMNEKCAELGLKGTHFTNPTGLHSPDHYSTCHEIALIFEAAMDNEEVAKALGTAEYTTSPTARYPDGIWLTHTLLYERLDGSDEFDGRIKVIGGKTGFTDEAGNCLVTMAEVVSTGKRYLFVCAGGQDKWKPVFDTIHVYRNYLGEHYDGEFIPISERTD
ncbi:MAG: hypothetical protein IJT70_00095 [Clostridia bacterium]|nr:hypothetical protein [Clostridia bacterium]